MMAVRSLLCLLSLAVAVGGECIPSLCDHGSCIDGECQCEPNYFGPDCSIPFETCEDGEHTCFNGSQCVRNNHLDPVTNKYKYHCDCTKASGVSSFAGIQCQEAATSYCVEGRSKSEYAFCTNGGGCVKMVVHGSPHPGCNCPEDFEGMHCQYLKGEAPEEDTGQPYLMYAGEERGVRKGIAVFVIVIVCLSVIMGMGYVIYRKKKSAAYKREDMAEPDLSASQQSEII